MIIGEMQECPVPNGWDGMARLESVCIPTSSGYRGFCARGASASIAQSPAAENPTLSIIEFMNYVYVLWSEKLQKRYVGSTSDIANRLKEHNHGKTTFTSRGIPWILIYQEEFSTLSEARKRESFLKSGSGRSWLDKNLKTK